MAAATDSAVKERVREWEIREPEEMYDLEQDADCLHNLVNNAGLATVVTEYRADLLRWMAKTHDPLLDNYQHRQDTVLALADFYKVFPEAEKLDNNKQMYSKGKGKGED